MAERSDEFRPQGGKLKVSISRNGEVEITGNRMGLKALSKICSSLSESVGKEGNHYHFMDNEGFWGTEAGSVGLIIYGEDL